MQPTCAPIIVPDSIKPRKLFVIRIPGNERGHPLFVNVDWSFDILIRCVASLFFIHLGLLFVPSEIKKIPDAPQTIQFDLTYASPDKSVMFGVSDDSSFTLMYQMMPEMTPLVVSVKSQSRAHL